MKVFVAGATGVLGRRTVDGLVDRGHRVNGVARSPEKAAQIRELGAVPIAVDLFDEASVKEAVHGHDAVCNLATHIPGVGRAMLPGAWAENDKLRSEASRILVDASLSAGVGRYVQEAITFVYEDGGGDWIDESAPVDGRRMMRSVLAAEANAARFTAAGGSGVVLRFGLFHAADSAHTIDTVRLARRGIAPSMGRPGAYVPVIHADDAATAVVAALDAPSGVYNVVDDEPLTRRDYARALAQAVARKRLRPAPGMVALMRSLRVSNARFKELTGWAPAYASAWDTWREVVGTIGTDR